MHLSAGILQALPCEHLGNIDLVEFITGIAELATDLDLAAFFQNPVDFLSPQHTQHAADLLARA